MIFAVTHQLTYLPTDFFESVTLSQKIGKGRDNIHFNVRLNCVTKGWNSLDNKIQKSYSQGKCLRRDYRITPSATKLTRKFTDFSVSSEIKSRFYEYCFSPGNFLRSGEPVLSYKMISHKYSNVRLQDQCSIERK